VSAKRKGNEFDLPVKLRNTHVIDNRHTDPMRVGNKYCLKLLYKLEKLVNNFTYLIRTMILELIEVYKKIIDRATYLPSGQTIC
jgi:hypothetical protein